MRVGKRSGTVDAVLLAAELPIDRDAFAAVRDVGAAAELDRIVKVPRCVARSSCQRARNLCVLNR